MHIYVYIVEHNYFDGRNEICGVFCTNNQAREHAQNHTIDPDPDMATVSWRQHRLFGFPQREVLFGVFLLAILCL